MKNIIFMTACVIDGKESRATPYRYGIESFKRWASVNGCELFVLTEPIADPKIMKPNFYRYYCYDLLDQEGIEYDQILLTDADAIIHPDCPNFFYLSDRKYCVTHSDGDYDWVIRSMENYAFEFEQFRKFDIWSYFNAGFQIINKEHRHIFDAMLEFYWDNLDKILSVQKKYGVGTDQPILNHIVHSMDVQVKYLPYQFCMADLPRKNALNVELLGKLRGIYQFNAIPGGDSTTLEWMETVYNCIYGN